MATASAESTSVQLARFLDGRLELFEAQVHRLDYIAVSHVWGDAEWLHVASIGREIYASPQKAEFIQSQLPALVGSTPFWMDTLTVNQRDQTEVISIVQKIPTIFRHATKTLAIREDDGFYECCAHSVNTSDSWEALHRKIREHVHDEHVSDVFGESFLLRLWTLQECLLSHTIQFVKCSKGKAKPRDIHSDIYMTLYRDASKSLDALYVLACSFSKPLPSPQEPQLENRALPFVRAFLACSSVTTTRPAERRIQDDIFSDDFVSFHRSSDRSATKSRDYIFATMPQFPWYRYPHKAESMTFGEIFVDLHAQSANSKHPFSGRFVRSMTEPMTESQRKDIWLPSLHWPEPSTLGDFLKLLGNPFQPDHCEDDYHITTFVDITSVQECTVQKTFDAIQSTMQFNPRLWDESYRCGELSRYGAHVQNSMDINILCRMVQQLTDPSSNTSLSLTERHQQASRLRALLFAELQERDTDEWLTTEAMKLLTLMWCAVSPITNFADMNRDWELVRAEIARGEIDWSSRLQGFLTLLPAMLGCQIPLSASSWAKDHFTPVLVHCHTTKVLGLVAKHAMPGLSLDATQKKKMLSVGRHTQGRAVGKDLVLVNPVTKMPVGLIPDFLNEIRTDEMYVERMGELYYGIQDLVGPRGMVFNRIPLNAATLSTTAASNP